MTESRTESRDQIVNTIRQELVGPMRDGTPIDCSKPIVFPTWKDSYGAWKDAATGEEILTRDTPVKRYGVGVLYSFASSDEEGEEERDVDGQLLDTCSRPDDDTHTDRVTKNVESIRERVASHSSDDEGEEFDISLANSYRPSSIGASFLAELPEGARLVVRAEGGRYKPLEVHIEESNYTMKWWMRQPVSILVDFDADALCRGPRVTSTMSALDPRSVVSVNTEDLDLRVEVYSRSYEGNLRRRLLTVCLVNRTSGSVFDSEACLFQSAFRAHIHTEDGRPHIEPYPELPADLSMLDIEEKGLELLYRKNLTYAVGHGCAAEWGEGETDHLVEWICAECLPEHETPSITPDVEDNSGNAIRVAMAPLAGVVEEDDGITNLEHVIALYEKWIRERRNEALHLDLRYIEAANIHLQECERCAKRMRSGLRYLQSHPEALQAFQLANQAILLQQAAYGEPEPRQFHHDAKEDSITLSPPYREPDPLNPGKGHGNWRAFQIAFLLMAVESTGEGNIPERETVELIWFPTGGGKTEAYLGLIAFSLFLRRLRDPKDAGVNTIMRYTLRLLSTQQFQRAARLICAMEVVRRRNARALGREPFSIGLWVGSSNTPNTHQDAVRSLNRLKDPKQRNAQNRFVIDRCPWCGAQMGLVELPKESKLPRVRGYYLHRNKKVHFECPDPHCRFSDRRGGLPIYVVDEDIYEVQPSVIVGTVDKFALLAWKPEARALFGIGRDGERVHSPPSLIVQDELHLISGPLGSMVGLYEAVVEELCTDRRAVPPTKPKIVSSTATIRRYRDQIRALYAREDAVLFPPPGLEAADSFFARYATDDDGKLLPGKRYVGIHAPGLGSLQTVQVRTLTALLQAPMMLPTGERDPWWTLVVFFNSLRELGTSLSLLESDIRDYQKAFMNRLRDTDGKWRSFYNVRELTGRAPDDEIPQAIRWLSVPYPADDKPYPVDVCLASNILEVGIDISRLSLMVVVGQPKTTSQYIQVTGRVGREWWERPGLIFTIYSASKPRDRSHLERFRSYHERLYAQVEPTSVTPFSPSALDRALHAVMVAYARQTQDEHTVSRPFPYPEDAISDLKQLLSDRISEVDPQEHEYFDKVFERRSAEWRTWQKNEWSSMSPDDNVLMYSAGSYIPPRQRGVTWPTPLSLRNVDAECVTELLRSAALPEEESVDA